MPVNLGWNVWTWIALGIAVVAIVSLLSVKYVKKKILLRLTQEFGQTPKKSYVDMEEIAAYHGYYKKNVVYDKRIDDITWNDLNMDEVFQRINACSCSVGEEYLYHVLREMEADNQALKRRERLIKWMEQNPEKRIQIQKKLLGIGKKRNNRLSYYLFHANAKVLKFAWVFTVMAFFPIVGIGILSFSVTAGIITILSSIAANIVVYSVLRMRIEGEMDSMQCFFALLYSAKKISKGFEREFSMMDYSLRTKIKPFKNLGGRISGNAQRGLSEVEALIVIVKAIFLVDPIHYNRTVRVMNQYQKELRELYQTMGEIDLAISIASFRQSIKQCCLPEFTEENRISCVEVFHPLLEDPVVNSANITNNSIVTGSNASGKSTFIKTLAINCILAQTIHTCTAKCYKLSYSYVATSMALKDNILFGESYFVAEIKSLLRILNYCKRMSCTIFIDEVLRGTNTPERIAASTAVLKTLHEMQSLTLVASHDIELTELLCDRYDNYHFCETFEDDQISFDYLLKEGAARSTNAIKLLKYMGFEKKIVEEATWLVTEREKEKERS